MADSAQSKRLQMNEEYWRKKLHVKPDGSFRYKFKGFAERISEVNIDVFHRTGATESVGSIDADSNHTYFGEAANRWRDLNITAPFQAYMREVYPLIATLPQLIYHRNTLVEITRKHLVLKNPLSLRAILDLLATLARDLRGSHFPNFSDVLVFLITDVLDPIDAQSVEDVFTCICLMFKYLQRQLVRDFDNLFIAYQPMFAHSKQHIRDFAAESLSFLFRKIEMERLPETVLKLLASTNDNQTEDYSNGLALLFFHSLKGTQGQFHSRANEEIPVLLRSLDYDSDSSLSVEEQITVHARYFGVISNMTRLILTHTKRSSEANKLVWNLLNTEAKRVATEWHDSQNASIRPHLGEQLGQVMLIAKDWASKARKYIPDLEQVCVVLRHFINPTILCDGSTSSLAVQRGFGAFLSIQVVLSSKNLPSFVAFFEVLAKYKKSSEYMLDAFRSIERVHLSGVLSDLFVKYIDSVKDLPSVMDLVVGVSESAHVLQLATPNLTAAILDLLKQYCAGRTEEYPKVAIAVDCLSCVQVDTKKATTQLTAVLSRTPLTELSGKTSAEKIVVGKALSSIARLYRSGTPAPEEFSRKALEIVMTCPNSVHILEGAGSVLSVSPIHNWVTKSVGAEPPAKKKRVSSAASTESVSAPVKAGELPAGKQPSAVALELLPLVASNASNISPTLRKATLALLVNFAPPALSNASMETFFQHLLDIENTPLTGTDAPHMVVKMDLLSNWLDIGKVPKQYNLFLANYLIGAMYIKYNELAASINKSLTTLLNSDFDKVWPVLLAKLTTQDELAAPAETEETAEEAEKKPKKRSKKRGRPLYEKAPPKATIFKPQDRQWTVVDTQKLFDDCLKKEQGTPGDSVDAKEYGRLLWNFLGGVVTTVEAHSKDIVAIFLDYIKQTMPNLLQKLETEMILQPDSEKNNAEGAGTLTYGASLVTYLGIFAKFRKPSKMYQAELVYNVFDRLLSNQNPSIQKLALYCILAWRSPSLVPYRQHLELLPVEAKYRDALVLFNYMGEEPIIHPDHRKDVANVAIKLLWPKIIPLKEPTKGALIMEWFAGFDLDEIQPVMDFFFGPFAHVITLPPGSLLNKEIVTPKIFYQTNFLIASDHFLDRLPNTIMDYHITNLLKVILYVVSQSIGESKEKKIRRNLSFERLAQLLGSYTDLDYSAYLPPLGVIVEKCMKYVTDSVSKGVLSLFRVLAVVPFLASLLKENEIMPRLIRMLRKKGDHQVEITGMLEDIMEIAEGNPSMRDLITPNVTLILEVLPHSTGYRAKFQRDKTGKMLQKKAVQDYFKLIASLSEYTTNPVNAAQLLNIIAPVLYRSNKAENIQLALLTIASNQIPYVADPITQFKPYMRQFAYITSTVGRNALVSVLDSFAKRVPELVVALETVKGLQASKESAPDMEVRVSTLKIINDTYISTWSAIQLRPIIHVFAYLIQFSRAKETALVTGVLEGVEKFAVRVANEAKLGGAEFLELQRDFLMFVYNGLRNRENRVRMDFMTALGHIVTHVPQLVSDLACLKTPKINFFKDIQSTGEKVRREAYLYFAEVASKLSMTYLISTFLPFFEMTLVTADIPEKSVVDAIVAAIGSCTKYLPWTKYTHYIKQLMKKFNIYGSRTSALVGALCSVVDNFHFADVLPAVTAPVMPLVKKADTFKIDDAYDPNAPAETEFSDERYGLLERNTEMSDLTMEEKVMKEYTGEDAEEKRGRKRAKKEEEEQVAEDEEEEEEEDQVEGEDTEMEGVYPGDKPERVDERMPTTEELRSEIIDNILPLLLKHVSDSKKGNSLRVYVAMAVVKLLRYLPQAQFDQNLPGLITKLCLVMASKSESDRVAARKTIVQIAHDLGPYYLLYLLSELNTILSKGVQRHIFGVISHAIVADLTTSMKAGEIDYCFPLLSKLIIDELFGKLADEKEKKMFKEFAEARSSYACQTLQIICTKIDFKKTVGQIVQLVHISITSKKRANMEDILSKILNNIRYGVLNNESVEISDLLIFIFNMVKEYILVDRNARAAKQKEKPHKITREEALTIQPEPKRLTELSQDQTTAWFHLVGEMALKMLNVLLRSKKGKLSSNSMAPMVDPYVSLLLEVMNHKFTPALIAAVKAFAVIIEMKTIPSLATLIDSIVVKVFALLLKSQDPKLTKNCFKFAIVLTDRVTSYTISEPQLISLVSIVAEDVNDSEKREAAFEMLQALLKRKLVCPEIYDLMSEISKILIRTMDETVRDYCIHNFVTFLIHYPLGNKRLDQHMHFLIQNLNYKIETGRIAVLHVFRQMVTLFPVEVIKEYSSIFFVPLVSKLASDSSSVVRKHADEVLKLLIGRLDQAACADLFTMTQSWFTASVLSPSALKELRSGDAVEQGEGEEDAQMDDDEGWEVVGPEGDMGDEEEEEEAAKKKAATKAEKKKPVEDKEAKVRDSQMAGSHLIAIFAEAQGEYFEKHISNLLPAMQTILEIAQLCVGESIIHGRKEKTARKTWGNVYALLKSLERIFAALPNIILHSQFTPIWFGIYNSMLHPHGWVRLSCTRLLGVYFSKRNLDTAITKLKESQTTNKPSHDLLSASPVLYIFTNSILLLKSATLTAKMGEQIIKNLVFLIPIFTRCTRLTIPHDRLQLFATSEYEGDNSVEVQGDDEDKEEDGDKDKESKNNVLWWLFQHLLLISRKKNTIKNTCIFHLIGALTTKLRSKQLRPYLPFIVKFFYQFEDNAAFMELKREVRKAVMDAVGGVAFASAEQVALAEYKRKKAEQKEKLLAAKNDSYYQKVLARQQRRTERLQERAAAGDEKAKKLLEQAQEYARAREQKEHGGEVAEEENRNGEQLEQNGDDNEDDEEYAQNDEEDDQNKYPTQPKQHNNKQAEANNNTTEPLATKPPKRKRILNKQPVKLKKSLTPSSSSDTKLKKRKVKV